MGSYRSWQDALGDCIVPDQWDLDREAWPQWCWPHLTPAMVDAEAALPFHVVYAVLVERSGLPMPARAVLQYLARRCGGPKGSPRRCWPPLDTIADRVGASRRTVQRAIDTAEAAGWVRVVRHTRAPSDYVLDVPDLEACPCLECRDPASVEVRDEEHDHQADGKQTASNPPPGEGVRAAPQGVRESPQTGQRVTPGCQSGTPEGVRESHALGSKHLVQSLDPALDSEHLRAPPDGAAPRRPDRHSQGRQYAELVDAGSITEHDVASIADTLHPDQRRAFLDGYRQAKAGAA